MNYNEGSTVEAIPLSEIYGHGPSLVDRAQQPRKAFSPKVEMIKDTIVKPLHTVLPELQERRVFSPKVEFIKDLTVMPEH